MPVTETLTKADLETNQGTSTVAFEVENELFLSEGDGYEAGYDKRPEPVGQLTDEPIPAANETEPQIVRLEALEGETAAEKLERAVETLPPKWRAAYEQMQTANQTEFMLPSPEDDQNGKEAKLWIAILDEGTAEARLVRRLRLTEPSDGNGHSEKYERRGNDYVYKRESIEGEVEEVSLRTIYQGSVLKAFEKAVTNGDTSFPEIISETEDERRIIIHDLEAGTVSDIIIEPKEKEKEPEEAGESSSYETDAGYSEDATGNMAPEPTEAAYELPAELDGEATDATGAADVAQPEIPEIMALPEAAAPETHSVMQTQEPPQPQPEQYAEAGRTGTTTAQTGSATEPPAYVTNNEIQLTEVPSETPAKSNPVAPASNLVVPAIALPVPAALATPESAVTDVHVPASETAGTTSELLAAPPSAVFEIPPIQPTTKTLDPDRPVSSAVHASAPVVGVIRSPEISAAADAKPESRLQPPEVSFWQATELTQLSGTKPPEQPIIPPTPGPDRPKTLETPIGQPDAITTLDHPAGMKTAGETTAPAEHATALMPEHSVINHEYSAPADEAAPIAVAKAADQAAGIIEAAGEHNTHVIDEPVAEQAAAQLPTQTAAIQTRAQTETIMQAAAPEASGETATPHAFAPPVTAPDLEAGLTTENHLTAPRAGETGEEISEQAW